MNPTDFSFDYTSLIPLTLSITATAAIAIFWLLSFFVLYHLIRFGVGTKPKQLALIYLLGSVFLNALVTYFLTRLAI